MDKLDLIKEDKNLYTAKPEPQIIEVPAMQYLMVDGQGAPEDNLEFERAFNALYGVAYSIKFMPRKGHEIKDYRDFRVPPPEGLWWMRDGKDFDQKRPEDWRWTLMIRMPEFVTEEVVGSAVAELALKKKSDVYWKVRLDTVKEGKAIQMMHIGPYDAEGASIEQMDHFVKEGGYSYTGKHHEIYFSDPRRTRPEKLKTLLRHPVKTLKAA